MEVIHHPANTRGHANHGWLDTHHTFSFAGYYNPERIRFGKLRVLNDDIVAPGMGFGTHPHENMEIISIPLYGSLTHKDSMGHTSVIKTGDVQVMSAGTGMEHSEFNASTEEKVNFLQIWIFPRAANVQPRYDQAAIELRENGITPLVMPGPAQEGLWVHQDTWISRVKLQSGKALKYQMHRPENGLYCFQIEGSAKIEGYEVNNRDGLGLVEVAEVSIQSTRDADILLLEIPM